MINEFKGISLSEMNDVELQKRTDTKFVLPLSKLPVILEAIQNHYRILEIKGQRLITYKSLYFDTQENKFYLDHHNGKIRRTKIRMRQYVESDLHFLEVKIKDGRGKTNKRRIPIPDFDNINTPLNQKFIQEITDKQYDLHAVLFSHFQRFTIVNKVEKERVTIDINLSFEFHGREKKISNLAIIELKQPKFNKNSAIAQVLKNNGIHAFGFSKYCLGMTHLFEDIKYNAFKPQILRINKITA